MLTPVELERHLRAALHHLELEDLLERREAAHAYSHVRQSLGLRGDTWSSFLSDVGTISKLAKGPGAPVISQAFAHAGTSRRANLCAHAGLCITGCVADSGNGGYSSTKQVRAARTALLIDDPVAWFSLLVLELDAAVRKVRRSRRAVRLLVRLNAYSDIRFERILPAWFWERYALERVGFYDYTKHPLASRPLESLPANYRLTYSYSERTSRRELERVSSSSRNVAAVVDIRGGSARPIPLELLGRPTVDGDKHDRRYVDPVGVTVVLRRKGVLRSDSAMVVPTS